MLFPGKRNWLLGFPKAEHVNKSIRLDNIPVRPQCPKPAMAFPHVRLHWSVVSSVPAGARLGGLALLPAVFSCCNLSWALGHTSQVQVTILSSLLHPFPCHFPAGSNVLSSASAVLGRAGRVPSADHGSEGAVRGGCCTACGKTAQQLLPPQYHVCWWSWTSCPVNKWLLGLVSECPGFLAKGIPRNPKFLFRCAEE